VALFGGIGGSRRGDSATSSTLAGAAQTFERAARSSRLGVGTLACNRCDAPVAVGPQPLTLTDPITCPYCGRRSVVRDFLSLRAPTRPARVVLRVALPVRPGR
jgi:DNA-directed RNA polymerase subunit RPC12/RpoP